MQLTLRAYRSLGFSPQHPQKPRQMVPNSTLLKKKKKGCQAGLSPPCLIVPICGSSLEPRASYVLGRCLVIESSPCPVHSPHLMCEETETGSTLAALRRRVYMLSPTAIRF